MSKPKQGGGQSAGQTVDVAHLMEEIRDQALRRGAELRAEMEELERVARKLANGDLDSLAEDSNHANQLFEDLHRNLPAAESGAPDHISFADLAGVPGAARPWTSPKRWIASLYRLLWRRQENFNREVVRRLEVEHQLRVAHIALSTRLLGTMNSLVSRTVRQEMQRGPALPQDLTGRIEEAIERMVAAATSAAAAPPSGVAGPAGADSAPDSRRELEILAAAGAQRVDALAARLSLLEKELARLAAPAPAGNATDPPPPPPRIVPAAGTAAVPVNTPGFDFLSWEQSTRGTEATIAEEQGAYLRFFQKAPGPVLDAGCGRGEFLEILRGGGVEAYGIDADPGMVAHCRAKGLRVEQAALFDHLTAAADESLGGIFLGQVVEHLPPEHLAALAPLAFRKLRPEGVFVAETINTTCLTTFSGAFYADPTHVRPVHPVALEYFLRQAGFADIEAVFSAPVPESDRLAPLCETEPISPGLKSLVLQANANIRRLNDLLYSHGNYALAARKPR